MQIKKSSFILYALLLSAVTVASMVLFDFERKKKNSNETQEPTSGPSLQQQAKKTRQPPEPSEPDLDLQIQKKNRGRLFFQSTDTSPVKIPNNNSVKARLVTAGRTVYGSRISVQPDKNLKLTYKIGPYVSYRSTTHEGRKIPPGIYLLEYQYDSDPEELPSALTKNVQSIHSSLNPQLTILNSQKWRFYTATMYGSNTDIKSHYRGTNQFIHKAQEQLQSIIDPWANEILSTFQRFQNDETVRPNTEFLRRKCEDVRKKARKLKEKLNYKESSVTPIPFEKQRNRLRHVLDVIGPRCVEHSWQLYRNLQRPLPLWIKNKTVRGGIIRNLNEVIHSIRENIASIDNGLPEHTEGFQTDQLLNNFLRWSTWLTLQPYWLITQLQSGKSEQGLISDLATDQASLLSFLTFCEKWLTVHLRTLKIRTLMDSEKKSRAYNWISRNLIDTFKQQFRQLVQEHSTYKVSSFLDEQTTNVSGKHLREQLHQHLKTVSLTDSTQEPDCFVCPQ